MSKVSKLIKYVFSRDYRYFVNAAHGRYKSTPDDEYIRRLFKARFGFELDLDNPQTFNEKLQWLKLYDRKPEYTTMVDKYAAKQWVADRVGEEYIIPTLGVWENFDEIDFDSLPEQFVLKCTHDSGGVVIVRDKSQFDKKSARKKLNKCLRRNFYYKGREWPYKNVLPRIIAEQYMEDSATKTLNDYKLQCFAGKFDNIFVAEGRYSERGVRYHYFDREWNYLPYCPYDDINISELNNLRPKCYEEMISIAERLSKGLPELRVDLYEINGRVCFGEMTFYSQAGFDTDITPEADRTLGRKLVLPAPNA